MHASEVSDSCGYARLQHVEINAEERLRPAFLVEWVDVAGLRSTRHAHIVIWGCRWSGTLSGAGGEMERVIVTRRISHGRARRGPVSYCDEKSGPGHAGRVFIGG